MAKISSGSFIFSPPGSQVHNFKTSISKSFTRIHNLFDVSIIYVKTNHFQRIKIKRIGTYLFRRKLCISHLHSVSKLKASVTSTFSRFLETVSIKVKNFILKPPVSVLESPG